MKIAILTSSRADYSIFFPLLKAIKSDPFFEISIIAFGTHLSAKYGKTVNQITSDGFEIAAKLETIPDDDSPKAITKAMGRTMVLFSEIWEKQSYDLIMALGDRYEVFAACASVLSFGIPIAHIHGGETTLGAIDDAFRHSITQMAKYHFTTTEEYKKRVIELKGSDVDVYNVGALSVDNLKSLRLLSIEAFREQFNIDMNIPSILITFHPETVAFDKNERYIDELIAALKNIYGYQFIITMPNADTTGNIIRNKLQNFIKESDHTIGIESFGTLGYLSCIKHCVMMLGNTSSGFAEAAFFPKYVINLGERQTGRIVTDNIVNCQIERNSIIKAVQNYITFKLPASVNIYGEGNAAPGIISILKSIFQN